MERLTQITEIGNAYFPKCFEEPCCGMGKCIDNNCNLVNEVCKKLAEYEQLEEQGLLVRLPCKVGDILFRINKGARNPIIKMKVSQITMERKSYNIKAIEEDYGEVFFSDDVIGIKVFATREEAEKKLEELKNEI